MRRATLVFALVVATGGSAFADTTDLKAVTHADLRRVLNEERKINLERFHAYRRAKVYPHNSYEPGRLNVWRDTDDHLCAVATLVHLDGNDELVETIASADNFVKTSTLTDGPLIDWVLTSGFTQEEVVMIQAPTEEYLDAQEAQQRAEARRIKRVLAREDKRLARVYKTVETTLETDRIADAGLELATERLAQHPELAARLLAKYPATN
ncbi:hypothetical protein BH11MYX1_BH11MYX1_20020 [soil metagenome]